MKHILICSKRNAGKTQVFRRLLAQCRRPIYGFITRVVNTRPDGCHEIYMFPADGRPMALTEANHVGECNMKQRRVNPDVFSHLGMELLRTNADGILAMDELGFMEACAPDFCNAVLAALDGDLPVLATVKAGGPDVEFLEKVRNHPKAKLYMVTPETADALVEELSPVIEEWNRQLPC